MQSYGLAGPSSMTPQAPTPAPLAPSLAAAPMRPTSLGGLVTMESVGSMQARQRDLAKAQADAESRQPVIQGLAGYVRACWAKAYIAKLPVEKRMLKALRARRGEYDPEQLAEIRKQGGSEIFMMLTSVKSRQATSLLRDALTGDGDGKPWTIDPSQDPDLPPNVTQGIMQEAVIRVQQMQQQLGQMQVPPEQVRQMLRDMKDQAHHDIQRLAAEKASRMEDKMEDQTVEGGWVEALDQLLDDMMTFPTAFLKGPVVRKRKKIEWMPDGQGNYNIQVVEEFKKEWERVDPFNIYPAPWAKDVNDAWLIERHHLSRDDISSLIGVDGYSEAGIRSVLDAYDKGHHELLMIDTQKALAEGRENIMPAQASDLIDAVQFWGSVSGKMLLEWGMDKKKVPDSAMQYDAEVWLIGHYVIKAVLNTDPLARRPYYATGYERVPGAFWHNSLYGLIEDCQDMCNGAGRALANNLGIASGPQVVVNVDRLPVGEDITELFPWKIHQTTSDPMGSTAPAVTFFQPSSNAQELMMVYGEFSALADEYSGIPKYMTGTEGTPGAGRTATGLNMMIGNASKTIKQVVANIDMYIIKPSIQRLYEHNMRYETDPDLKGDVNIVAKGSISVGVKESLQQRRNEFLQTTANPIDMQIVGLEGRGYMLGQAAKSLGMDVDRVVPSLTELRMKEAQQAKQQQQAMQMQQAQAQQQLMATQEQAAKVGGPSQSGQTLMNGAPVSDQFSPIRR